MSNRILQIHQLEANIAKLYEARELLESINTDIIYDADNYESIEKALETISDVSQSTHKEIWKLYQEELKTIKKQNRKLK